MAENETRVKGVVKWFSNARGYGFIAPNGEGQEDVFVHFSGIAAQGYRSLREGEVVEFTIEDTPKGPQAIDVVKL